MLFSSNPNQIFSNCLGFPLTLTYLFRRLSDAGFSERCSDHEQLTVGALMEKFFFFPLLKPQGRAALVSILESGSQMSQVEKVFRGGGGVGAKAVSYHS